jgi:uncharacterized protein (DUF2236 family)
MSRADQDIYFAQFADVARRLGAAPVPESRAEAEALVKQLRPKLRADARTREVARLVLRQKASTPAAVPVQKMIMEAAVDLLPYWARALHSLPSRHLSRPVVRLSTAMVASSLRWAFARDRHSE